MAFAISFFRAQLALLKISNEATRPKTTQQKICIGITCLFYWTICFHNDVLTATIFFLVGTFSLIADADLMPMKYYTEFCVFDRVLATLGGIRLVIAIIREGLYGDPWHFAFMLGLTCSCFYCLHRGRLVPNTVEGTWAWTMWHSLWHFSAFAGCYALYRERTYQV